MIRTFNIFLVIAVFFAIPCASFAQEIPITEAPSPTPVSVDYQLPYPGLLPDNPLYTLKAFRDKVIDFLISDPLKKSEFYLLQADKRLQAGVAVFDKGEKDLAESTISKAENYMEDSVTQLKKAKEEKIQIAPLAGRIVSASKKHQEVLRTLEKKAPSSLKESFKNLGKRIGKVEKEAVSISK